MTANHEFESFLVDRLQIDARQMRRRSDWAGTGNTIGALALRLGLLELQQIDRILNLQESDRRLFGELAVHLGFMTSEEVDRLIELQHLHQLLEIGETHVVAGRLDTNSLLETILEFRTPSTPAQEPSLAIS